MVKATQKYTQLDPDASRMRRLPAFHKPRSLTFVEFIHNVISPERTRNPNMAHFIEEVRADASFPAQIEHWWDLQDYLASCGVDDKRILTTARACWTSYLTYAARKRATGGKAYGARKLKSPHWR